MAIHQSSPQTAKPKDSRPEVEVYNCGCKVRFYQVDQGEWEGDPETQITVREVQPCPKHDNNGHSTPPQGSRLVAVLHEPEGYLNE